MGRQGIAWPGACQRCGTTAYSSKTAIIPSVLPRLCGCAWRGRVTTPQPSYFRALVNPRSGYLNRLLTQLISSLSVSEAGAVRRARALATACARPPSSPTFAGKMYEMMYNEDDSLSGKIPYSSGARSASLRLAGCGNARQGLSLWPASWAGSANHDRQPR